MSEHKLRAACDTALVVERGDSIEPQARNSDDIAQKVVPIESAGIDPDAPDLDQTGEEMSLTAEIGTAGSRTLPRWLPAARLSGAARQPSDGISSVRSADNVPIGIFFMIAATLFFAISNALTKWLVAIYPVGEVMFVRSMSSLAVTAAVIVPFTGLSIFATQRAGAHIARGLSQSISQAFTVIAFSLMPLAAAIAINFSAPLWAALVATLWLKDRAGLGRWAALLAGFSGVIIVAGPGADAFQVGALFALANAMMYGSVTVAVRGLTATESTNTLIMWQMVTIAVFHSTLLVFGYRWPTGEDAALLVLSGVANSLAQYTWTTALVLAPTTAVAPFYYFLLVWATAAGFVIWGEIPTPGLLIGSVIVVASGLFLLWHEAKQS